jgi:hypothetical protein
MGLFSGIEADDDDARGGFLKRLRGARPTAFVEAGRTATRPAQEPRFNEPTKAINPTVSFLGRKLSGDDIMDVDDFTESDGTVTTTHARSDRSEPRGFVETPEAVSASAVTAQMPGAVAAGGVDESIVSLGDAYAEGEKALRELDELIAAQSRPTLRTDTPSVSPVTEATRPAVVMQPAPVAAPAAPAQARQRQLCRLLRLRRLHRKSPTARRLRTMRAGRLTQRRYAPMTRMMTMNRPAR